MKQRILIADEQALFRQGLGALLAGQEDLAVVAEAADAAAVLDRALALKPDTVVLDPALAGTRGTALVESLKRRLPALRVLVLTALRDPDLLRDALRAGVDGYLSKDSSFDELLLALRCVASGRRYLSPSVSGHLVDVLLSPGAAGRRESPLAALTARERSILQLIAEGLSNRHAAEALSLSTKTIEKHRANLMRKLGLRNAGELLMVAVETGLVQRPGAVSRLVATRTG
ncbi:MAG: response regulator transcription factor [Rubrivivax sp.]